MTSGPPDRTLRELAEGLAERRPSRPRVVAVGGGVAVGKSTVAAGLATALEAAGAGPVAVVATDGYLLPNAELAARGLTERKGFPESYDLPALRELLRDVRAGEGPLRAPVYAHRLQDRVPDAAIVVDRPATLVLEGLAALDERIADLVDVAVYVDAAEELAASWYLDRFRAWRIAAANDPGAFLHPLRDMPDADAEALAMRVWETVNLPNVRANVLPGRARADVVLVKDAGHALRIG